jgi:stearoyl-CoA desaturase (Delta-9 desaturase)
MMVLPDWAVLNALVDWLAGGLWPLQWWQIVLFTLLVTHITIASVTIFLHRHQAHRALDLHPMASHFFRFWLWLTTGMVTREWAAIHRKHHAKCEQAEDPHSPQVHGLKKVFWQGSELYRAEAKNQETLARYGHGTPDDWIERNLYSRFSWQGVGLMLIIDVLLFGVAGLAVWAVQMAWIPVTAAGIINGVGHYWGYRNFEATDASTNVSPWGILIGGEELHNNHHTYPTSAKLSVKAYEFDIGWAYIRMLQAAGLATVKKISPRLAFGDVRPVADEKTLEAVIANRYEVMAGYARGMRDVIRQEIDNLRARKLDPSVLSATRRWLPRDADKVPADAAPKLSLALEVNPVLAKMVQMREELRQIWMNTSHSREQLAADLQAWCRKAEESGIAALREFSLKLRAVRVAGAA